MQKKDQFNVNTSVVARGSTSVEFRLSYSEEVVVGRLGTGSLAGAGSGSDAGCW